MWNIQSPTWPVAKQQLPTSISTCDHSWSCIFPPQVQCMRTTWVLSLTPKWAIFYSNKMHWYILNLLESNLHTSPLGVTMHMYITKSETSTFTQFSISCLWSNPWRTLQLVLHAFKELSTTPIIHHTRFLAFKPYEHAPTIPSSCFINHITMQFNIQVLQNFYMNDVIPHLDKSPMFLGNCEFPKDFTITTKAITTSTTKCSQT